MNLNEMKSRLREIGEQVDKIDDDGKIDKLLEEAEGLHDKINLAEKRAKMKGYAESVAGSDGKAGEVAEATEDEATKRGKALMNGGKVKCKFMARAAGEIKNTVTSSSAVLTQHTAQDVKPTFNEVSSLIDRVKIVSLPGGESYTRGFVKSYGTEGGYTEEGGNYTDTEPKFGYSEIQKTKITAYCEEPEEIIKLAPADYDRVISDSVRVAGRKKITREILIGTDKIHGIFYNPTEEEKDIIDRSKDIAISTIDENTLDEIIFTFGGDEGVEDVAVLILNKADLKAFATCRKTDGNKAYTVVRHGNTGTIDGVPFIINSACKAITNTTTATNAYCMAYGPLSNYELAIFSDMDVQRSTEYKFKQGQIAHRSDIFVGGNVAAHNGFLRVKKK